MLGEFATTGLLQWLCNVHKVTAPTPSNVSSARVLEKAGFTFEGRLRKSVVKDGVILDQLMHSILRDEVFPPPVEPEAAAAAP